MKPIAAAFTGVHPAAPVEVNPHQLPPNPIRIVPAETLSTPQVVAIGITGSAVAVAIGGILYAWATGKAVDAVFGAMWRGTERLFGKSKKG